jgi:hypothetical protein
MLDTSKTSLAALENVMQSPVTRFTRYFLAAAACTVGAVAYAGDDRHGPDHGDRIVGLWATEAMVGPCTGEQPPVTPLRNTLLFHAGGTLVESPRFGPNGVTNAAGVPGLYQRGQALGTWVFDRSKRVYFIHLRFDNYVDNAYHGYSIVEREITLSRRGMVGSGPVRSTRYYADGWVLNEVCGNATSTPL